MKKIVFTLSIVFLIASCKKEDCPNLCVSYIEDEIALDIHYNKLSSCNPIDPDGNFEIYFKNENEYDNDLECNKQPIPFALDFDGIIIAQGVKVPYVGLNGGDPGYNLDVCIKKDSCIKAIDFHFILNTIDTSRILEHNENVIVLLNGIDSTYTINFSHEINPYRE